MCEGNGELHMESNATFQDMKSLKYIPTITMSTPMSTLYSFCAHAHTVGYINIENFDALPPIQADRMENSTMGIKYCISYMCGWWLTSNFQLQIFLATINVYGII